MKRLSFCCGILLTVCASAAIIHVPADQPTIQTGIDVAVNGDTVLVADGTYTGDGNRDIHFKGKAITVMSENGAETCVIDCEGDVYDPHRGFYFDLLETNDSILDGFTIRNGLRSYGGGIRCENASPTIKNCFIVGNSAEYGGGGLLCESGGSPIIVDCTFVQNSSKWGGGINVSNASASISNCTINGNHGLYFGGGIACYANATDRVRISDCVIANNIAEGGGGTWLNCTNTVDIVNCLIISNFGEGGAFYFEIEACPCIINCTVTQNNGSIGGAIYARRDSMPKLSNCILWDNYPEEINGDTPQISFSVVRGGYPGEGNIDVDPLFIPGDLGSYYLSHIAAGQTEDSPCIDAGSDPAETICYTLPEDTVCMNELWTRTDAVADQGQVDMGCHYPLPPEPGECIRNGDVDFSGELTCTDAQLAFMIVLGAYTPTFEEECAADCNGSYYISMGDVQDIFSAALGSGSCFE